MLAATPADRSVPPRLPRVGYVRALDGMRALAVVAVLLYHGNVKWLPGGFLGVDVFFVISGYLITSLLLSDWREHGRIELGRFYVRRARRLLPALFLMLAVVAVYALLFLPDAVGELRGQELAAIFYIENWYLIFHKVSYFVAVGRPSLLRHVWSLAVEEQFYLLWPVAFWFLLARFGRRRNRLVAAVAGCAIASAIVMAVLYEPFTDPSRVYFGTDTRASTMFIGAALAIIWTPWRLTSGTGKTAPYALDAISIVGLVGVVWFFLNAGEFDDWMYHGGFLVLALFTTLLLATTIHPSSRLLSRLLGMRPLVWIGVHSYGIYLWHWPVFMVTRPHSDLPLTGIPLLVLRIAITFVLAAASYRLVEKPVRNGAVERWLQALRGATGERRRELATRIGLLAAVLGVGVLVIAAGLAVADPAPRPEGLPKQSAIIFRPNVTTVLGGDTSANPESTTTTVAPPGPIAGRVTAVGDSVMLGAATALRDTIGGGRLWFDAQESRQFGTGVDLLQALRDQGQLGDEVVVHLGTNGTVNPDDFDRMMAVLKDVKKVVVVNAKVARPWEGQVNGVFGDGLKRYKKVVLVDWHTIGGEHPELFWRDGIHLRPAGAQFYAQLIAGYL